MHNQAGVDAVSIVEIIREAQDARTYEEATGVNRTISEALGARRQRYIADRPNNHGLLLTPGSNDEKSLEPVTNMHDAVLELEAIRQYGCLEKVRATNPRAAVAELLPSSKREELAARARVDIFPADNKPRATRQVTMVYRDGGAGLTPDQVAGTIFHAGARTKDAHPWMSGAFGLGGLTTYPNAKAVVLVTRRHPDVLAAGEPDLVTVAVCEWETHTKGRGIFYLVGDDDLPLSVPAASVDFDPGTHLALVCYSTEGFHTGRNDRNSFEFLLNTRLWDPPLPTMHANYVARGDHPKAHQGRKLTFAANPRPDRKEMSFTVPLRVEGATYKVPIEVYVFAGGPSGDKGAIRNFVARGHAALFVANGQAHGTWSAEGMKGRTPSLSKLYSRMLVVADLDELPVDFRTQKIFTPDRVTLQDSPEARRLQETLARYLDTEEELLELNRELIKEEFNRASGRSTRMLAKKIGAALRLRGGVSFGGPRPGGDQRKQRRTWASEQLHPDPTTIEGPTALAVRPGDTRFFDVFVNAEASFYPHRGHITLECDHPRIGPGELTPATELRRGVGRCSVLVPEDVEVGERASLRVSVRDWQRKAGGVGRDLVWDIQLRVVGEKDPRPKPEPAKGGKGAGSGGEVVVLWSKSDEEMDSAIPGKVELLEAEQVAKLRPDDYGDLAKLGQELVPVLTLNEEFRWLAEYESRRVSKRGAKARDAARERFGTGAGTGLLVLFEQDEKARRRGEPAKRDRKDYEALGRAAAAMLPEYDMLLEHTGLEGQEADGGASP